MKLLYEITGITPLLMCRFDEGKLEANYRVDKSLTPREEAENFAYYSADGSKNLIIPMGCMMKCLIDGGKDIKLGRKQISTSRSSILPGYITITNKECSLGTKKFEVDSRYGKVPTTNGAIMIHRPRLDVWKTKFEIDLYDKLLPRKKLREVIDNAGLRYGILAFRPARNGWFGKFKVTLEKVLKK
jgi:hypothetical protein